MHFLGPPRILISDQGTHFKNQLFEQITHMAGVEHKFTTAYVPWSNGSVERANKEVLRVCRALSSDMRMSPDHWIDLVGLVEAAINHSPTANAAEHAPFTILTGMPPRDQLSAILSEGDTKPHEVPTPIKEYVENLQAALRDVHREVFDCKQNRRKRNRAERASKPGVGHINISTGGFVIMAYNKDAEKNKVHWTGPYQVTKPVNDWVFELTSLVPPHQTKQVHLQRIEYLSGPELLQEIPKKELEELARFYDGNFTIERLGAIRAHARHG